MIRLAIDRNHLDRDMVRRSLRLLTRIFCLFCHNSPHLLILRSLVAVYYYNYVEVSSYNKKVQASRNTSLLPLQPTMNVIMQINRAHGRFIGPRWMFRYPDDCVKTHDRPSVALPVPEV